MKPEHSHTKTHVKNKKHVIQLTLNGDFVKEFESTEAVIEEIPSADNSTISKCCKGKRSSHKGFKWLYKEDYDLYLLHQKDEEQGQTL